MNTDNDWTQAALPAHGPGEMHVVAIYGVEDGKIAKAWFKMGPPRLTGGSGPA